MPTPGNRLRHSDTKLVQQARGRVTRASDTGKEEYRVPVADRSRRLAALDRVVVAVLVTMAAAFVAAYTWHGIETGSQRGMFRVVPAAAARSSGSTATA